MLAYIKDDEIIINTMIFDNEKDKLVDFVNKSMVQSIKPIPLYNTSGDISGIAFKLN